MAFEKVNEDERNGSSRSIHSSPRADEIVEARSQDGLKIIVRYRSPGQRGRGRARPLITACAIRMVEESCWCAKEKERQREREDPFPSISLFAFSPAK